MERFWLFDAENHTERVIAYVYQSLRLPPRRTVFFDLFMQTISSRPCLHECHSRPCRDAQARMLSGSSETYRMFRGDVPKSQLCVCRYWTNPSVCERESPSTQQRTRLDSEALCHLSLSQHKPIQNVSHNEIIQTWLSHWLVTPDLRAWRKTWVRVGLSFFRPPPQLQPRQPHEEGQGRSLESGKREDSTLRLSFDVMSFDSRTQIQWLLKLYSSMHFPGTRSVTKEPVRTSRLFHHSRSPIGVQHVRRSVLLPPALRRQRAWKARPQSYHEPSLRLFRIIILYIYISNPGFSQATSFGSKTMLNIIREVRLAIYPRRKLSIANTTGL